MKIDVLENTKDKLKIQLHDNLTLVNLLNENLWQQNIDMAAYRKEHIYISQPELIIKSKNPKKDLLNAAEQILIDVETLKKRLKVQK